MSTSRSRLPTPYTRHVHLTRSPSAGRGDTDGQPGALRGRGAPHQRVGAGGVLGDIAEVHIWTNRPIWPQGFRRPRTLGGGPPAGLVPAVEPGSDSRHYRRRHGGRLPRARGHELEPLPGTDPKGYSLPPRLPSLQLARLGRLRGQRAGRHGRAPRRPPLLGPGTHLPYRHRGHLDPLGRPGGRPGILPALHAGLLRVPSTGRHAPRRHALVRWRPHAAPPEVAVRRRRTRTAAAAS